MNIRSFYQEKFKKYGVSPKSLLWKEKGAAHQRFRQFWAELDFTGESVLDIGCGFGELGHFLTKRYAGVTYTGMDIVPEFIKEGKLLYPTLDLVIGDFLTDRVKEKYNIVIASGVLNSNLPTQAGVADNMEYRKRAIAKMFEYTKGVLAFNMLGGYPQPVNDSKSNIWYADSLEILKVCFTLTRRVILRANYHPRDFTIIMYKVKKK